MTDFKIVRSYSPILGLQNRSQDEYSVYQDGSMFVVRYLCKECNRELKEEVHITGLSFDVIKSLLIYLSENAVRYSQWTDIVKDYCYEHGAYVSHGGTLPGATN